MLFQVRNVLISDPVDSICCEILQNHGIKVTCARQWSKDRLFQEIQVNQAYWSFMMKSCYV